MITIDDFKKLEIRIGRVLSAEKVENADKLLKMEVDFGSADPDSVILERLPIESGEAIESVPDQKAADQKPERITRQILSGIAQFYKPEDLIGKEFPFVVNLEPRIIRDLESQGMILAVNEGGKAVLLSPEKEVEEGSSVG